MHVTGYYGLKPRLGLGDGQARGGQRVAAILFWHEGLVYEEGVSVYRETQLHIGPLAFGL